MPSLRIIYDVDGWAYHRNALGLQKHAPADFEVTLAAATDRDQLGTALGETAPDVILLLPSLRTPTVREILRQRGWQSKLVACWSVGLPFRMALFQDLYEHADAWIINNQDYWDGVGRLPQTFMVPFGVDSDIFHIRRPPESRTAKALWVGSQYFRRLKGYDRLIVPLATRLRRRGIELETLLVDSFGSDKRSASEMADWYNHGTVLVCASEAEGTPNPALEAAACGCTVVSTPVGNMPQLIRHGVNGYLVERNVEALADGVAAACENYLALSSAMQADIATWDWRELSTDFYQVFRTTLEPAPAIQRRDLREQVTAFVSTVGAPTFATCQRRLEQQDCLFQLKVVDHVAPMSAAFQRMLDDCQTPFFVQVDEDMLLFPNAIGALYDRIHGADDDVAMYCADLYDAHLRRCILGVKIFRHAIARQYPFEEQDSFEVSQLDRMASGGWRYLSGDSSGRVPVPGRTLGLHGVQWTPASIYERYLTLVRRRFTRPANMDWVDQQPLQLLQRFLDDPTEENFFAVQGAIAGALAARAGEAGAKDYRRYGELPGFAALEEFLRQFATRLP